MEPGIAPTPTPDPASLIVVEPHGHRTRIPLEPLPFRIGRAAESNLILRDSRASRTHARVFVEGGSYWIEDCRSLHGTFVNGKRITREPLQNSDKIEFGAQESYQLIFALDGVELKRMMEQMGASEKSAPSQGVVGGNLAKLRAILDLARTLQSSFSVDDVLVSVVDTALAITGAERGFLLLRGPKTLEMRVARHRKGTKLHETDLRVPREVIHRAVHHRRELLSMNFDPMIGGDNKPANSIADIEARSVICVPLVRIRAGRSDATSVVDTNSETVGVIYMDSRSAAADLAGGNRELLQTLAIEASTVLENARLLEEESAKHQMEEELRLARTIQQSLLPNSLPVDGWMLAAGSSVASRQVGGDYYDVAQVTPDCWSAVVADVSGKGVGSALLASLLQGALIAATEHPEAMVKRVERLNRFLLDRTSGEKYATMFYSLLHSDGRFYYVNAAHCPPLVVRAAGEIEELDTTAMPVGLLDGVEFPFAECKLEPGDKVVIYTDGVTEAENGDGDFFGKKYLCDTILARGTASCAAIHDSIQDAVTAYTHGDAQSDDITVLVLEYKGPPSKNASSEESVGH